MWWRKPEKPLRRQLLDAQAALERQIEIMSVGTIQGFGYQPGSKEQLQEELAQINQALADLGAGSEVARGIPEDLGQDHGRRLRRRSH